MYGEKSEEAEELRLDLQDVKEMYKQQVDGEYFNHNITQLLSVLLMKLIIGLSILQIEDLVGN